jgi:hypothetical protein
MVWALKDINFETLKRFASTYKINISRATNAK